MSVKAKKKNSKQYKVKHLKLKGIKKAKSSKIKGISVNLTIKLQKHCSKSKKNKNGNRGKGEFGKYIITNYY